MKFLYNILYCQRATKDAGAIAGLEVLRIINEPTAASLAFGLDKKKEDMKIMVFDFGGGTLDVTIMEMGGGVFEVMSTSGDTQLGGSDMDKAIIDYVIEEFRKKEGIDLSNDSTAMTRIKEAGEKAKIELSTVMETEINLPFIANDPSGAKNLEVKLTRAKLEDLVNPIVEQCKSSIDKALEDAKLSTSDMTKIVLVGGPTRMPIVKKFVSNALGKDAESGIDPMEAVAFGAAIQAGIMAGEAISEAIKTGDSSALENYEKQWRGKFGKEFEKQNLARKILARLDNGTVNKLFNSITPEIEKDISDKEDFDFHTSSILKLLGMKGSFNTMQALIGGEIKRLVQNKA